MLVSIYNVEEYLPSCLDSILNQSYRNLDIVLIDDGSTDRCGKICDQYANMDSRVRVFHVSNRGVSAARNLGMCHAKGEWLTFVDADDLIPQDTFAKYIYMAESEDVDVVMAHMRFDLNAEGTETFIPQMPSLVYRSEEGEEYVRQAISNFRLSFWGKLYRKSILNGIRFPESISNYEDFVALWQVALKCPSYSLINHVGYIARCRSESASRARMGLMTYQKRVKSLLYVCEKMLSFFRNTDSIRKDLTKFVIVEGLANRGLYVNFIDTEIDEVITLTNKLWDTMQRTCIIPWHMRILLSLRVKLVQYNINDYPIWQYAPIRIALRFI
ncbi:glycosyltransferase family 2 protein [Parabacteroides sp.]